MSNIDYVALSFRSDSLDPAVVTHELGVFPTKAFAKGDLEVHPAPTRFGYWRLRIDRTSGEVDEYLTELLDSIPAGESAVAHYVGEHQVDITIVADVSDEDEGEMTISDSVLERIAATKASLRFYWLNSSGNAPETLEPT